MRDNTRELIVLMVFVFMIGIFLVWQDNTIKTSEPSPVFSGSSSSTNLFYKAI